MTEMSVPLAAISRAVKAGGGDCLNIARSRPPARWMHSNRSHNSQTATEPCRREVCLEAIPGMPLRLARWRMITEWNTPQKSRLPTARIRYTP